MVKVRQRWRTVILTANVVHRFNCTANFKSSCEEIQRSQSLGHKLRVVVQAVRAVTYLRTIAKTSSFQASPQLDPAKLGSLVRTSNGDTLKALGGTANIIKFLKTSSEDGVMDDDVQWLEVRKKKFGSNTYTSRAPESFLPFAFRTTRKRPTPIILTMVVTLVRVTLNLMAHCIEGTELSYGAAILFSLLSIMLTCSFNYWQYLRFLALLNCEESINTRTCEVIRSGKRKEVPISDIVVGDIVLLKIGDEVPADGLLVQGHSSDLYMDQSRVTEESEPIHVNPESPYLLSGSKVHRGSATMVVTAVGMSTLWGQKLAKTHGECGTEDTLLEKRLKSIRTCMHKVRPPVRIILYVVLFILYFVRRFKPGETSAMEAVKHAMEIVGTVATVEVFSLPEGLPLAVILSLAYAMKKMMADKAVVRSLSVCETMGSATTICSDKTGTLTLNRMSVAKAWAAGAMRDPVSHEEEKLHKDHYDLLFEGIAHSSNGSACVPSIGEEAAVRCSQTENATLMWGLGMGMDFSQVRSLSTTIKAQSLDSATKKAGVAIRVSQTGKVHVHWEGAAEVIVSHSNQILCPDNSTRAISTVEKIHLLNVIEGMAAESLRCVAFGYMEASGPPVQLRIGDGENQWQIPEGPLILLAIIGIRDPCRIEVPKAVRQCQAAGIRVRMVTGEHITTAKAIATECGILRDGDVAIDAATFCNYTREERMQEMSRISVMARSSPADKALMVTTLRELGDIVAVIGDGVDDASALRRAHVGISMGMQCTSTSTIAMESSAIIIADKSFDSILKVVQWGRAVVINIQKFIQFRLTVNVSALTINLMAGLLSDGVIPLSVIQLLWLNLFLDTLGAVALSTEGCPSGDSDPDTLLDRPPSGSDDPMISNVMWRNILSQAIYQVTVLLVLQCQGQDLLGLAGQKAAESITKKVVFNAFVLCQIFNAVNARKLEAKNVFKGMLTRWLFLGMLGTSIGFHVIVVHFSTNFTSTPRLDWQSWVISVLIGSVSWPLALIVKSIRMPGKSFPHD